MSYTRGKWEFARTTGDGNGNGGQGTDPSKPLHAILDSAGNSLTDDEYYYPSPLSPENMRHVTDLHNACEEAGIENPAALADVIRRAQHICDMDDRREFGEEHERPIGNLRGALYALKQPQK